MKREDKKMKDRAAALRAAAVKAGVPAWIAEAQIMLEVGKAIKAKEGKV